MKKPDAPPAESSTPSEACDAAFRDKKQEIAAELSSHILRASWWWRHREAVWSAAIALILGYAASILANVTAAPK